MHCTDEELIAHLDGELGWVTSIRIRSHLKRCWRCRGRLDSYERQIYSFIEVTDQWSFPGTEWKRAAKRRLNECLRNVEETLPNQRVSPSRIVKLAWGTAIALLLCFVIPPFHKGKNTTRNDVLDTVAHARAAEKMLFRSPVQAVLAVEIEQTRPRHTIRRSRLEAWSDQANGRFASRWSSENGTLKLAAWKPREGSELIYRPSVSPLVIRSIESDHTSRSLASLADNGLDPAQVETAFMRWMEARAWQPISLSENFSAWSKQDGTLMHMERQQLPNGLSVIHVIAQRANQQKILAILTVELEADTYRPRLQNLLLQDATHEIQIRLAMTSIQEISSSQLTASMFLPSPSLPKEIIPAFSSSTRVPSVSPESFMTVHSFEEITKQLEARYALHKAGACLGSPVEISETVHGVLVRARETGGFSGGNEVNGSQLKDVLASLADLRNVNLLPIESLIAFDLSEPEIAIKQHLLALQLLARDFPVHRTVYLTEHSWKLLEEMIRDHTSAIRAHLDILAPQGKEIGTVLAPVRSWREVPRTLQDKLEHLGQLSSKINVPEFLLLVNGMREEISNLETSFNSERLRAKHLIEQARVH